MEKIIATFELPYEFGDLTIEVHGYFDPGERGARDGYGVQLEPDHSPEVVVEQWFIQGEEKTLQELADLFLESTDYIEQESIEALTEAWDSSPLEGDYPF